jgi:hypothetical protein
MTSCGAVIIAVLSQRRFSSLTFERCEQYGGKVKELNVIVWDIALCSPFVN